MDTKLVISDSQLCLPNSKDWCSRVSGIETFKNSPTKTKSWRALRPKKRTEEKFYQLLENVRFVDEQEFKTIQTLFASHIFKENDFQYGKSRTKEETEFYIVESRVKEKGLIPKDHAIDIQGLKELANVTSAFLPITQGNHKELVVYQNRDG